MIEMLGVLAVIGVLSAGGIWGYNVAMRNYRVNKLVSDIEGMAMKFSYTLSSIPKATENYRAPQLHALGIVPDDLYQGDKYLKAPSGFKSFYVDAIRFVRNVDSTEPTNEGYSIVYKIGPSRNLYVQIVAPKYACVKMLMHDWRNKAQSITVRNNYAGSDRLIKPATMAEAEEMCSYVDSDGYTEIRLNFNEGMFGKQNI